MSMKHLYMGVLFAKTFVPKIVTNVGSHKVLMLLPNHIGSIKGTRHTVVSTKKDTISMSEFAHHIVITE